MDDAMLLPASDSSLAWVYEGATPAMTPDDAATAIRAATIGWTRDDHLQMGALQHHLAVALCDDPERQAVCSAAAFMHVAAAGMDPGSLLGKSLDPKLLRPKLGTKPQRIGTTRSGKPIYNMFTHPAHASFKTADHVDHIKAMETYSKEKKMNKASGEGSRGGKVIGHTKSDLGAKHRNAAKFHYRQAHRLGFQGNTKKSDVIFESRSGMNSQQLSANNINQRGIANMHKSEAVSILENFLAKSNNIIGKTSSGFKIRHPSHRDYQIGGTHTKFRFQGFTKKDHEEAAAVHEASPYKGSFNAMMVHRVFASGHVGKLAKSGEGSRGGKVVGHTRAGKAIYSTNSYKDLHSKSALHNASDSHSLLMENRDKVLAKNPKWTAADHNDASAHHSDHTSDHGSADGHHDGPTHYVAQNAHYLAARHLEAKAKKSMSKSGEGSRGGIMGMPVDLGDMQGSPIDGSYVDSMGGSHDLFMQQAELANCPTMWAPIATVPEN